MSRSDEICAICKAQLCYPNKECQASNTHDKSRVNGNDLFVSKSAKIIYALTKMRGKHRNRVLGIKPAMFAKDDTGRAKIKKWYDKTHAQLELSDYEHKGEAYLALDKLYNYITASIK